MQTMNISFPDRLKEFVDQPGWPGTLQHRQRVFGKTKNAQPRKAGGIVGRGIQSGRPAEMTRQDWKDIRREALKQLESRGSLKTA
jgi:hypothetical protein